MTERSSYLSVHLPGSDRDIDDDEYLEVHAALADGYQAVPSAFSRLESTPSEPLWKRWLKELVLIGHRFGAAQADPQANFMQNPDV